MTVTICVTRANFICYEGQKSGCFEVKTCFIPLSSKDRKSQTPDFQYIINKSKNKRFFNQLYSCLKKRPYFEG